MASSCRARTRRAGDSSSVTDDSGCCQERPARSSARTSSRHARSSGSRASRSRKGVRTATRRFTRSRRAGSAQKPRTCSSTRWCLASSPATHGSFRCGRRFRKCGNSRRRTAACSARCSRGAARSRHPARRSAPRSGSSRRSGTASRHCRGARVGARPSVARTNPRRRPVADILAAGRSRSTPASTLHADHVVLAASPAAAANLIAPLEPTLAATLVQIPIAPIAVIALGFDGRVVGPSARRLRVSRAARAGTARFWARSGSRASTPGARPKVTLSFG